MALRKCCQLILTFVLMQEVEAQGCENNHPISQEYQSLGTVLL